MQQTLGIIHSRWINGRRYLANAHSNGSLWIYCWGERVGYRTTVAIIVMADALIYPHGSARRLDQMIDGLFDRYAAGELEAREMYP